MISVHPFDLFKLHSTCLNCDTVLVPQVLGQAKRLTNPLLPPVTGLADQIIDSIIPKRLKVRGRPCKNITYKNVSVRSTCFSGDTVSVPQVLGQGRRLTNPLPQSITGLVDQIIDARIPKARLLAICA